MASRPNDGEREQHGPTEVVQFGGSPRPGRPARRWVGRLAPLCLVAAAVIVVVLRSTDHHQTPPAPPPPALVTVTSVGHAILGVRSGWELFALEQRALVTVQFARGRITRTVLPPPEGAGIVSLILDPAQVLIRPLDNVPGYVVPDGRPPRTLGGILARGALLLPGPGPAEVWDIGSTQAISLIGPNGKREATDLGAQVGKFPPQSAMADGRGNVLIFGSSGRQYDAGPGLFRPVGALVVAVGPRSWLGLQCGQVGRCRDVVINAATGARRVLPGSPPDVVNWQWPNQAGAVSPDGSTAAVFTQGSGDRPHLILINLSSGSVTRVAVPVTVLSSSQNIAWSPDSRWLFVVTASGRLVVVDAQTGRLLPLALGLSGIRQIAIRSAAEAGGSQASS